MSHAGRPGPGLVSTVAAMAATLAVAGCASTPPPPPPPVTASVAPVEKPAAAPRPTPPPRPVDLHWAFSTTPALCTALASGRGGSLQIQTTTARQIMVSATFTPATRANPPRARAAKLSFSGPAGEWSVPGTWQGNAFSSSRPLDERGVASVLGLLGGGTAVVTAGPLHLGSARLPPSSGEGSAWAQCPKQMMTPS